MKKFLLFALSFLPAYMMASGWDGQTIASSYAGGDGTEESPYLISTAEELAKLAADLNADPSCTKGVFYRMTTASRSTIRFSRASSQPRGQTSMPTIRLTRRSSSAHLSSVGM